MTEPTPSPAAISAAEAERTPICPECSEPALPAASYCEACGAPLAGAAAGAGPRPAGPVCPSCGAGSADASDFCDECGQRMPRPRDRVELDLGGLAAVSDRGLVHERNEDAVALARVELPVGAVNLVAVVCDGVSHTHRPDEASEVAATTGRDALVAALRDGFDAEDATRAAVSEAAAAAAELARPEDEGLSPSCTFVSAVATADGVTVGWIGDSRAYWLAAPGAADPDDAEDETAALSMCLTRDHTVVAELVAMGALDAAAAATDPRAHVLSRWIGADGARSEPGVTTFRPDGEGAVVVCSDGLWNYLDDADAMAERAQPAAMDHPVGAASALVEFALLCGGHDNITVAVIPVRPAATTDPDTPDAAENPA